ncbi:MAG: hypothetical protein STHCBS139747_001101 [Sporothrix thermara]
MAFTTTTTTALVPITATVTTTISASRPSQPSSSSFSASKTLPRSLRKRLPTPFASSSRSRSSSSSSNTTTNTKYSKNDKNDKNDKDSKHNKNSSYSSTTSNNTSTPRAGRGLYSSLSTPNLGSLFQSHARRAAGTPGVTPLPSLPHQPPPVPVSLPLLTRKASSATLTSSSLATIPDDTESYVFDTLIETPISTDDNTNQQHHDNSFADNAKMAPITPARFGSSLASYAGPPTSDDPVVVGDPVDVPGGMNGIVRFVGTVAGRKGVFAGVELHPEFAARGKNSGDVDGVSYFNTTIPGAGIFLPLNKAVRRDASPSAFPMTPTAGGNVMGLKLGSQNSINFTPPTPSLPKFSQSINGNAISRSSSPQHNRRTPAPRTSLPRPDSPVRRLQMTPAPGANGARPSLPAITTGPKAPSLNGGGPARYGSPTSVNKFSQSMRAPAAATPGDGRDPSKRGTGLGMLRTGPVDRNGSIGPRSVSALGSLSNYGDDDSGTSRLGRGNGSGEGSVNGSIGSAASFGGQQRGIGRPASRATSHTKNGSITTATTLATSNGNLDEEVERLRSELQDRERQLKDQASTLADMESSLTELQGLIESSDGPLGGGGNGADDEGDKDVAQLRALLREKNEKIAMLTAEFDTHRADFRSTIDTLEMASTETERVYEKKIEEMMLEIQELESRLADVDAVAHQLKQLEELVQELEEGLEDARRGEAEARGEVEFLRGEVERTRTELRREREKAAMMVVSGASGTVGPGTLARGMSTTSSVVSKELEQKDDEIRGLKAIIHSLSQNAGVNDLPNGGGGGSSSSSINMNGNGNNSHRRGESINERLAREALEREVAELRAMLDTKSTREMEMEREIEQLRLAPSSSSVNNPSAHRTSAMTVGNRSSLRDSRGTVVLAREFGDSMTGVGGLSGGASNGAPLGHARSSSNARASSRSPDVTRKLPHHSRGPTLDTMAESDAYSSVTDSSTLWCEICETNGHDILTCTNMFGTAAGSTAPNGGAAHAPASASASVSASVSASAAASASASASASGPGPAPGPAPAPAHSTSASLAEDARTGKDVVRAAFASPDAAVVPLKVNSTVAVVPPPPEVKILPNPMESGPVAGKESGVVDASKWCALCERDGHDSVDCPFEDAF